MTYNKLFPLLGNLQMCREGFKEECARELPGVFGAQRYARQINQELSKGLEVFYTEKEPWVIVSVGGLGRGELSFESDLDLLFLYTGKLPSSLKSLVEALITGLWDYGFEVGHMVSSMTGIQKLVKQDFTLRTTYLESQFIAGNQRLYRKWRSKILNGMGPRQKTSFLEDLIKYKENRMKNFGDSSYLVEPEIKQGPGGLRDIQSLRWLGVVLFSSPLTQDWEKNEWITDWERQWLDQGQDTLWRVRFQLHLLSGRKRDRLLLQDQEVIARNLGFIQGDGQTSPVEAFMRKFYRTISRVRRITSFLLEQISEDFFGSKSGNKKQKILPGPFLLKASHLSFCHPEVIQFQPEVLMDFFWQVAKSQTLFYHHTGQVIRANLQYFTEKEQTCPKVIEKFFQILMDQEMGYVVLKVMLETGFLERFIPEFSYIRYMRQYDLYHIYTVDEHLLRTVLELHRLERAEENQEVGNGRLFEKINHKRVLYLAALIHDLGKGQGKSHAQKGVPLARQIGRRLQLEEEELELLCFLVRNHLLLAETALKRDLTEEKPVENCALRLENKTRLYMLHLLTVADSKATGPKVWTSWRKALLNELLVKIDHLLGQEEWQNIDVHRQVRQIKQEVLSLAQLENKNELVSWLESLSLRYLLNQSPSIIIEDFHLEKKLTSSSFEMVFKKLQENLWQVSLVSYDRPGLFEAIAGVFWANGLNILSADLYTRDYGYVLDRLIVDQVPDPLQPERVWARVKEDFSRVIDHHEGIETILAKKQIRKKKRACQILPKETTIIIDEKASDFYTVIEVYTWERPGLLYTVSGVLHRFGLTIKTAKITTPGAQVLDVFYVRDEEGNKVTDQDLLESLKSSLYQELEECY